jgi:hypothetical protein
MLPTDYGAFIGKTCGREDFGFNEVIWLSYVDATIVAFLLVRTYGC